MNARTTRSTAEFTDASLAAISTDSAARPVYSELEVLTLSYSASSACANGWVGSSGGAPTPCPRESPDALAARLIAETKLDDAEVRKQLWQGGKAAVGASLDPMIELAREVDGDARAVRKQYEDEVEAPIAAASEKNRRGALRGLRHPCLPGCDIHSAPELRHGSRVGGEWYAG